MHLQRLDHHRPRAIAAMRDFLAANASSIARSSCASVVCTSAASNTSSTSGSSLGGGEVGAQFVEEVDDGEGVQRFGLDRRRRHFIFRTFRKVEILKYVGRRVLVRRGLIDVRQREFGQGVDRARERGRWRRRAASVVMSTMLPIERASCSSMMPPRMSAQSQRRQYPVARHIIMRRG